MSLKTAGHLLVECLIAQGVDTAFGVPGESYLAVLDGLYAHRERIRFVTCRQEGGAAYMGKWLEPVAAYVRRHRAPIGGRPTWLFSSGPVGTETVDKNGQDVLAPPPFLRLAAEEVGARGIKVFFGRWDPDDPPTNVAERLFRLLPVSRELLPVGDFRDWPAIEAWGHEIAGELRTAAPNRSQELAIPLR